MRLDLERELGEIVGGLRLAAEHREALADAAALRGESELAAALRLAAAHARSAADLAVDGLARLYRARIASPEWIAQTAEIQRLARLDREAEAARASGLRAAAEERVAARRRGAA